MQTCLHWFESILDPKYSKLNVEIYSWRNILNLVATLHLFIQPNVQIIYIYMYIHNLWPSPKNIISVITISRRTQDGKFYCLCICVKGME